MTSRSGLLFTAVLALAAVAQMLSLGSPLFLADSSIYAEISRHMAVTGDFVNLVSMGADWLDKPHFQFWISALSMKLFGVSAFAFKLPALLFFLLGVIYTYLLAREFYGRETGFIASLMLLTAMSTLVSNNDVRAEAFLVGLIPAAVFHLHRVRLNASAVHVVAAGAFTACAVMTKGIFVIIPVAAALCGDMLFRRDLRSLFRMRWLAVFALTALLVLPEIVCLYLQFDAHVTKMVFGRSGVRFFLWDSQFGRFFNTGPIQGTGNIGTYFHVVLWAFLPWSLLLCRAVFMAARNFRMPSPEYYSISGAAVMFAVFSLSKFQLPHYINIIFPFLAIFTAASLRSPGGGQLATRGILIAQYLPAALLAVGIPLLHFHAAPGTGSAAPLLFIAVIAAGGVLGVMADSDRAKAATLRTALAAAAAGIYLNAGFIPWLLDYQVGADAGRIAASTRPAANLRYSDEFDSANLWFHAPGSPARWSPGGAIEPGSLLLTSDDGLSALDAEGMSYEVLLTKDFFHVTKLNARFLNRQTRDETTKKAHLLLITASPKRH